MLSVYSREDAAKRILWSLGMLGRPHQVNMLLSLLGGEGVFTIPGLARLCGVRIGLANYFVASLVGKGAVVALPRPEEPVEWGEVYGQATLNRKKREAHIIGPAPYRLDRDRLRAQVYKLYSLFQQLTRRQPNSGSLFQLG